MKDVQWNDFDETTKSIILKRKVQYFGKTDSFEDCLAKLDFSEKVKALEGVTESEFFNDLFKEDTISLTKTDIPTLPPYYISRKLWTQRKIDPKIFEEKCVDIFLVEGITYSDLRKLAGKQNIDRSSRQIHRLSARYLRLDTHGDFDKIVKICGNSSMHLIQKVNQHFFWKRTHGNLRVIQNFIHSDQDEFSEEAFISIIEEPIVCLADIPGMGKSLLLASICKKLNDAGNYDFVIFLRFSDLLQVFKKSPLPCSMSKLFQALASAVTNNNMAHNVILSMLESKNYRKALILDSFDEIILEDSTVASEIVQLVSQGCSNIPVYISTRTHLQSRLEQQFLTLSFKILPIDETQQADLLVSEWELNSNLRSSERLYEYSVGIIEAVRIRLNCKGTELVGIPLQCSMLAVIYEKDATEYATNSSIELTNTIDVYSIYDMYKKFVSAKLTRLNENLRDRYLILHTFLALELLHPLFVEEFKQYYEPDQLGEHEYQNINMMGLVQINNFEGEEGHQTRLKFLHRTYAEYFVAMLIVNGIFDTEESRREFSMKLGFNVVELIKKDGNICIENGSKIFINFLTGYTLLQKIYLWYVVCRLW